MLRKTSGKFGYNLYTGTETISNKEETFTRSAHYKVCANVEDLVLPQLLYQLEYKHIAFATFKVLAEKHLASKYSKNQTWKLDLHGVGDLTQNIQNLTALLSPIECIVVILGSQITSKQLVFVWVPPGAPEQERQRYKEATAELQILLVQLYKTYPARIVEDKDKIHQFLNEVG